MYGNEDLDPRRCQTWVSEPRGWAHQCQRKPTVTREGKFYCGVHDPEYIRAKNAKWQAAFDAERAKKQAIYALDYARYDATKGLTLEELKQITPELIKDRILAPILP